MSAQSTHTWSSHLVELPLLDVTREVARTAGGKSYFTVATHSRLRRAQGTYQPGASTPTLPSYAANVAAGGGGAALLRDTTVQVLDFDAFGNVLKEEVATAGVDLAYRVERTFKNDTARWVLGQVQTQKECSTAVVGGFVTMVDGLAAGAGGIAASATGVGAPVGVPVLAVATAAVVGGAANAVAGLQSLMAGPKDEAGPSAAGSAPSNAQPAAGGADRAAPSLPAFVRGGKTARVLRTASGDLPLQSGRAGPAASIPSGTSGFDIVTRTHVEGHAAAAMRAGGVSEATLYINNPAICTSCESLLPRMLAPGSRLTVVTPSGSTTFIGIAP